MCTPKIEDTKVEYWGLNDPEGTLVLLDKDDKVVHEIYAYEIECLYDRGIIDNLSTAVHEYLFKEAVELGAF